MLAAYIVSSAFNAQSWRYIQRRNYENSGPKNTGKNAIVRSKKTREEISIYREKPLFVSLKVFPGKLTQELFRKWNCSLGCNQSTSGWFFLSQYITWGKRLVMLQLKPLKQQKTNRLKRYNTWSVYINPIVNIGLLKHSVFKK